MSDNSEIPEGYKKGMENLDSVTYRKFVLGDWDVIDVDKPFAYAFDPKKHIGKLHRPSKSLPLYLSFDFNVDPITCLVGQHTAKYIKFHKEYRLRNSNIYALCAAIKSDWPGYYFYVTGDASGNNRSAMVQGNLTYYKIIQAELNLGTNQMQVPSSNPGLKNNRVLVNSMLEKFPSIIFDAEGCPYTIKDLQYCEVDHKGDIDKTKDKHLTHLLDCCRYYLHRWFFSWLKDLI
jgi:phage terminase large subunit